MKNTMIILFRFHDHYDLTIHNLKILKNFNRDHVFIGMYGGNDPESIPNCLKTLLDDIYIIPSEDTYWKWKNADLCVRQWYKDKGHTLKFSHIHLAEWDMLTLFDIKDYAPNNSTNSVTYCFDYKYAKDEIDWFWLRDTYYEWDLFKDYFTKEFQFNSFEKCTFGIMGGAYLCREYLEKFASIYPQSINNDEVRLGCFSALWNIPLIDNKFKEFGKEYRTADDAEYHLYNKEYLEKGIKSGAKVLHPVRHFLEILDNEK